MYERQRPEGFTARVDLADDQVDRPVRVRSTTAFSHVLNITRAKFIVSSVTPGKKGARSRTPNKPPGLAATPGEEVPAVTADEQLAQLRQRVEFGERLRAAINTSGLGVKKLAGRLGVSRTAVYDWLSGRFIPDAAKLALIAKELGVTPAWLSAGQPTVHLVERLKMATFIAPEQLEGEALAPVPVAFRLDWLTKTFTEEELGEDGKLKFCRVLDDSMAPNLNTGDFVLAIVAASFRRPRKRQRPNGIYILTGGQIRRVRWNIDGSAVVSCDNPAYGPEVRVEKEAGPPLEGRVVWSGGRL